MGKERNACLLKLQLMLKWSTTNCKTKHGIGGKVRLETRGKEREDNQSTSDDKEGMKEQGMELQV